MWHFLLSLLIFFSIRIWASNEDWSAPLDRPEAWQVLQYRRLSPNRVEFVGREMKVSVKASASPIILPLAREMLVSEVSLRLEISKLIQFGDSKSQGEKGADDFAFRLGFVVPGSRQLNWMQRQFAPKWVQSLYQLAPKGTGIDHIEFLVVTQNQKIQNTRRTHRLNELLIENFVWPIDRSGEHQFKHQFASPLKTIALWLAIDGDDSQAEYSTTIKQLRLGVPNQSSAK